MSKQHTLKSSFTVSGKGLHTGIVTTATFSPAPEGSGYRFQRTDLEGQPIIEGIADNVGDTTRSTVLQKGDVRIGTVEHALSALYGMGVDNCLIQVDGPEMPILEGSAMTYVNKITEVGREEQ